MEMIICPVSFPDNQTLNSSEAGAIIGVVQMSCMFNKSLELKLINTLTYQTTQRKITRSRPLGQRSRTTVLRKIHVITINPPSSPMFL